MRAYPKKIDTARSGFNACRSKSSRHFVAGFVAVQFAFGGDAMLSNEFARHVRQKVRAIEHLTLGNQIDTSKYRAFFVANAGRQALTVGVEVNAYATRCEAFFGAHADHASIAFDEGHLYQFSKVVHLSHDQLSEPGRDNAVAIKVLQFVGEIDGLGEGLVFGAQQHHRFFA